EALAAYQLRSIRALGLPGVQAAVFDGDSTRAERDWARSHARYLLTTPDMLHRALLPRHNRWSGFFSRLSYVVVDECHGYRGVFGSHVAQVLRRLRRVVAHHAPAEAGGRLVSQNVQTLAFIRSRRGAEAVALAARRSLDAPGEGDARVAAYRSGYLPEDRRRLEAALSDGSLVGLATTTALELGVNITGL